ncbi:MAG: hypothetical protein J7J31_07745 [Helicobacteraceae bacterium]|nr:hypothetical protein [Helicobacteraceae bacterium]
MKYIVMALKSEAQALVERYKLHKSKLRDYTLFENEKMQLIISGVGVENAMRATQTLIDFYDISDEDIYINLGICAASKEYEIGALVEVGTILYQEEEFIIHSYLESKIHCMDIEQTDATSELVDMESFGFYDAVRHSSAIKNFHIYKVVSDHFEPQSVTKDRTKKLISDVLEQLEL